MSIEDTGDVDQAESSHPGMLRRRRNEISHSRRIELQNYARDIAAGVMEKTKRHERCLLRRMVEDLLPGEE